MPVKGPQELIIKSHTHKENKTLCMFSEGHFNMNILVIQPYQNRENKPCGPFQYKHANRKYKDYVYRKMLVQEYLKKWRIFKRVKPKNDMMYHDIYNCICQNTKKIRFIIHYVKPTTQLLFRIRFPKGGPTCRRQVVNPRHQTSQGQSVAKPETPLQNIQVE